MAETSTNPEIQIGALRLLAQFEEPSLVHRALEYAVSGKVRNQDAAIQLSISLDADENRKQAWEFIQTNWGKVQAQLTTNSGSILVGSTSSFCSNAGRDDVEKFFSSHKVAAADQTLKHAIESIDGCIELRANQEPQLRKWLHQNPNSHPAAPLTSAVDLPLSIRTPAKFKAHGCPRW